MRADRSLQTPLKGGACCRALFDGERIRDIVTTPATIEGDVAIGPDKNDLLTRSFKDMDPALAEWAADRMTLHPRACFYNPVKLERF